MRYFLLIMNLVVLFQGCGFFRLEKELQQLEAVHVLSGDISKQTPLDSSVLILLFEKTANGPQISQAGILDPGLGKFAFEVKFGTYYLMAFEDLNNNLVQDDNEPCGVYGQPDEIAIGKTSPTTVTGLDIPLSLGPGQFPNFARRISLSQKSLRKSFIKIGQRVRLDDPLLAHSYGIKGYWEPLTFLREIGFCIYFTEPYDPHKIPVLFIHGALGTPLGWKDTVHQIDSHRFQPWFFYYPSGLPLEKVSDALNRMVMALHRHHGFNKMHVVAQSMGGLVARSFILKNGYDSRQDFIRVFISVSTPWNGHRMTEKGVQHAPTAIPSWYDMVPGSEFITSLFERKLPDGVKHYLFFSYKGDCSLFLANNDGTVELSSELDMRAQEEAERLFGYNEDHGTILDSEPVRAKIHWLLTAEEWQR